MVQNKIFQLYCAVPVADDLPNETSESRQEALRVMMDWTLDLFFGREIEQMITCRDVEALTERIAGIRA
jgi:hypothetical protein